jgi:hypothetical protein
MKNAIFALLMLLLLTADSFAAAAGTTLFNFLKMPLNASQAATAGMSGFTINSAGANPAMIPFFDRASLSASYSAYFQDTSFNSVNLTIPFKNDYRGINISYGGFDYGKMDSYTEDSFGNYVKNGTFGASDAFFGISYGSIITDEFYAGAGLKYAWQTIGDSKMSGMLFNFSAVYMPDATWYISGGIDNAGFEVEGYPMPSSLYISIVDTPEEIDSAFMYGFEFRVFFDETMWLKGACEFNHNKMFFARFGYSFPLNNDNKFLSDDWYGRNLSAGFGVEYKFFVVDYAWLPFGDLGNTSMISLQINF